MTTFYPTWEEANRNRSYGEEVHMGPDGNGRAMYYVSDADPLENKTESFTLATQETEVIAPVVDRSLILANMMLGFASLHNARPNLHLEWQGMDDLITVRRTDGWIATLEMWTLHIYPHKVDVDIVHDGDILEFPNPMDAITYMHDAMMRPEYISRIK